MSRQRHTQHQLALRSNIHDISIKTSGEVDVEGAGGIDKNDSHVAYLSTSDDEVSFVDVMASGDLEILNFDHQNQKSKKSAGSNLHHVRRRALKRRQGQLQQLPQESRKIKKNKENLNYKDIFKNHLEVIKKQSQNLIKKEKKINEIQRENEKLRQKIKDLAGRPVESFLPLSQESKISRKCSVDKGVVTDIKDVILPLKIGIKNQEYSNLSQQQSSRKKKVIANNNNNNNKRIKAKKTFHDEKVPEKKISFFQTKDPYFLQIGEDFIRNSKSELEKILCQSETPKFRIKSFSNSRPEDAENTEDESYNKRHTKLELEEKRRKKWDLQIIREQRNVEKLKIRYEKALSNINNSCKKSDQTKPIKSILQGGDPGHKLHDVITCIEVLDHIPVTSFGSMIPYFGNVTFKLPWMNSSASQRRKINY